MRTITLTGSAPTTLSETANRWDWVAQFRVAADPATIRFVDVIGPGGDVFHATLDRHLGLVTVSPFARPDFEAFSRANANPDIHFRVRFFMEDGTVAHSAAVYPVRLLDADDTPPQALSFSSGGTVAAGAVGATIGQLRVQDPDTASGFTFRIREDDAWLFEVQGSTLRLRPGTQLTAYDGPVRTVYVEVSDGRQSAGFEVRVTVTNPDVPGNRAVNTLEPGEIRPGFTWTAPDVLRVDHATYDLTRLRDTGEMLLIQPRFGDEVWARQPRVLDLLDGTITFDSQDPIARFWNIFDLALDREMTRLETTWGRNLQAMGMGEADIARILLGTGESQVKLGLLSNADFVRALYRNSVGWVDEGGVSWHASRLDNGTPREQILLDLAQWRWDIGLVDQRMDQGLFVERALMTQVEAVARVGLGMGPGSFQRVVHEAIVTGVWTLDGLADALTQQPGFEDRWAGQSPWQFAWNYFAEIMGAPPPWEAVTFWGGVVATGQVDRGDFMAGVSVWAGGPTSLFGHRPDTNLWLA